MSPVLLLLFLSVIMSGRGDGCTNSETTDLSDYVGNVPITNGGRTCQKWTSQLPHHHETTSSSMPMNSSLEEAENFCRSVLRETPWCYTTDPRRRWDYCDKQICGEPVCGGTLTDPTGWLTSLDSDGDGYADFKIDCLWVIVAPNNLRIEMQVNKLDIEEHVACGYDFLEVYERLSSYYFHGRFCGSMKPPLIRSRSHELYVRFLSDRSVTGTGFTANYSQVEIQDTDGATEGPWELSEYASGKIMCPPDIDIAMYTGNISLTNGGIVCKNWTDLEIEVNGARPEDKNYCRGFEQYSLPNPLPWCYTTDGGGDATQFCYEHICNGVPCGGVITSSSGWLSAVDRDGDGFFDRSRHCFWTLTAPDDYVVEVQLLYLHINGQPCWNEYLMMYKTEKIRDSVFLCGDFSPLPMTLNYDANWMYVRFKSDKAGIAGPGFNLTYYHLGGETEVTTFKDFKETGPTTVPDTQSSSPVIIETTENGCAGMNRSWKTIQFVMVGLITRLCIN